MISCQQNYGDESDAYGVVHPSVYANKGVYEKDFFQPRSESEIKAVFENIGVSLSPEVFKELWDEALRRHPGGKVTKLQPTITTLCLHYNRSVWNLSG